MKGFEGYKLHAVQERLNLAIKSIVERYRTDGKILTWRLAHQIEREALHLLEEAGDLDRKYIRMMRMSQWGYIPELDEPVELEGHESLPPALSLIGQAYRSLH
ncbi:MAG: DUF2471 family protein [Burkholderiaceae bacterium]